MPRNNTLEQKIIDIVAVQLGLTGSAKAEIHPGTTFGDDLGADSLDMIEINMAIEDELAIEIPEEAYMDITKATIAHMVKVVEKYIIGG